MAAQRPEEVGGTEDVVGDEPGDHDDREMTDGIFFSIFITAILF
jgi:hypothetical protein